MGEIERDITRILKRNPGLSDRELTDIIKGHAALPQYINQNCLALESQGRLIRKKREDGLFGNWLIEDSRFRKLLHSAGMKKNADDISEKRIKHILETYLASRGWKTEIAWNVNRGIDIEANRGPERWIIEVKGSCPYNPVYVNYFLSVLGEILQRMDDPECKYSIALPDIEQFHRLWERLPALAKNRTEITALFVNLTGEVTESPSLI
jgi:hypothetical protein